MFLHFMIFSLILNGVWLQENCLKRFHLFNGKCYQNIGQMNFYVANNRCKYLGSSLPVFTNENELQELIEILPKLNITDDQAIWLGIHAIPSTRAFHLLHNGFSMKYMKWLPNQPDKRYEIEECIQLAIGNDGGDDVLCESMLPFAICRMEQQKS